MPSLPHPPPWDDGGTARHSPFWKKGGTRPKARRDCLPAPLVCFPVGSPWPCSGKVGRVAVPPCVPGRVYLSSPPVAHRTPRRLTGWLASTPRPPPAGRPLSLLRSRYASRSTATGSRGRLAVVRPSPARRHWPPSPPPPLPTFPKGATAAARRPLRPASQVFAGQAAVALAALGPPLPLACRFLLARVSESHRCETASGQRGTVAVAHLLTGTPPPWHVKRRRCLALLPIGPLATLPFGIVAPSLPSSRTSQKTQDATQEALAGWPRPFGEHPVCTALLPFSFVMYVLLESGWGGIEHPVDFRPQRFSRPPP